MSYHEFPEDTSRIFSNHFGMARIVDSAVFKQINELYVC